MTRRRHALFPGPTLYLILLSLILLCSVPAGAQVGPLVVPSHLGDLVAESQVVVQGTVTSVALEPHRQLRNLMTVVVTVQVEDALKGKPGATYTFRQAVIDPRDLRQKMGYKTGQHVLLLMMKPSTYGLTSPAGLQQGRFQIEARSDGKLQAINGAGNVNLFRGLSQQMQAKGVRLAPEAQALVTRTQGGPIPLDQLKSLIRTLAAQN